MPFDPNIALQVRGIEVPNQLAQYGQLAQIQANQRQAEVSQMQLEELKNDRMEMQQFQQQLAAKGGNPDLNAYADMLLKSPKHFKTGIELKQKLKDQSLYENYLKSESGAAAPAMGAPATDVDAAPINALAPRPAMGAAAPVNAMAPRPANNEQVLLNKIRMLSASNDPRAKAEVDVLKAQLTELGKVPSDLRTMQALGYENTPAGYEKFRNAQREQRLRTPEEEAQAIRIANASRAPGTTVNMISEKAEQGARGKMLVDQYTDISKSAGLAAKTLPAIEANLSALNKGFDTGFGKETIAAGASVLAALGVKDAEKLATDTQKFQSNAINAVLQKQLEQKGPQTESDARRIEQIGAQLGKTKNANEFILSTAKEQLRRDVDQRNFYDRWYKTNKTYDGAEDAWFAGEGGKSLFDRPALKKYAVTGAAPSAVVQIPTKSEAPAARTVAPNIDALLNKYK
jgi:hypothetical protein